MFSQNIEVKWDSPEQIFDVKASIEKNKVKYAVNVLGGEETVIMVGNIGSGKSTLVNELYSKGEAESDYIVVRGDDFKSNVQKMLKYATEQLKVDGTRKKGVVFDATNGTKERRKLFVDWSTLNVPSYKVHCVYVSTDFDLCKLRNQSRDEEERVPMIAMYKFRKMFELPDKDEGFDLTVV